MVDLNCDAPAAITPRQQRNGLQPGTKRHRQDATERKPQPRYHVVLWDDDDHTYDYVIRMMRQLFGHTLEQGLAIASEVDTQGRAVCMTTTREHAELKRDQIHAFGRDGMIQSCVGSMYASIEPEPS